MTAPLVARVAPINKTPNDDDVEVLARTLWGEARGESLAGQQAVAWSIRNRVEIRLAPGKPNWWGEGYKGVCQAKYQFSCWNANDPNYPYLSGAKPIPKSQLEALKAVARDVMTDKVPDPTGRATHYYATTMPKAPAWAKAGTPTVTIGHHKFFRDVK